ncbi:MAG: ComEC/Rec2 family competence protein [Oscillospiraceae bacterium]|nr:ComEC/Rec2 family competence protein [Oscillospiraceae bacterium]
MIEKMAERSGGMRILMTAAFSFAAGCVLYVLGIGGIWCAVIGAFLLLCAAGFRFLLKKNLLRKRLLLILICWAAGLFWCGGYDLLFLKPAERLHETADTILIYAADYPQAGTYGWTLDARTAEGNRRIAVYDYEPEIPEVSPGDLLEVTGTYYRADRYRDERTLTDYADGCFLRFRLNGELAFAGEAAPGRFWTVYLADWIKTMLQKTLPERAQPLLIAMLTGDRTLLWQDEALTGAFAEIGISHMLAVSGMHVSILAGFILLLFGKRRWSAVLAAALSLGFAAMTGFSPSVTRAFVMQVFVLMAPILNRESDAPTSLAFALGILLFPNPYALASIGLQLSFLATAGLIWLAPQLREALIHPLEKKRIRREMPRFARVLLHFVLTSLAATVSALVMTAPLAAWYFGSASVIAPLANLLIVPAGEAAFCLGGGAAVLGGIWLPAGKFLGSIAGFCTEYILRMTMWFASAPITAVYAENLLTWVWIIFSSAVFVFVRIARGDLRSYGRAAAAVTVTMCAVLMFSALESRGEKLSVAVLDVGQGQCVAAVSDSAAVICDCGGNGFENPGDTAADYLHSRGITRVSLLVLTHFHDDHANGVSQLFARVPVEAVALPMPAAEDAERAGEILQLANDHGCGVLWITERTRITFGEARAEILPPIGEEDENERCLTVVLSAGEYDAVITGDLPGSLEMQLTAAYDLPDAELLVAGHHGSVSSTTQELLETITPEAAAISVGANGYGQPAEVILRRLQSAGIAVYRTDEDGTVTFRMR